MYSGGADLPPRLAALLNRPKGYAQGGVVQPNPAAANAVSPQPVGVGMQPQGQTQAPVDAATLSAAAKQVAQSNPQVIEQIAQAIQQALESGQLTPDQLNLAIEMAKAAAQNPALYPRLRELAIQRGLATEQDLPQQYDQGIVFALLLAAEAAQRSGVQGGVPGQQGGQQGRPAGYADGGSIPSRGSDPSGTKDNIKIAVSGGEYVIPKHVVAAKGTEFFDRMLEQYDPNNPESKVNKPK